MFQQILIKRNLEQLYWSVKDQNKQPLLRIERALDIDKSFNSLERYNKSKIASKYLKKRKLIKL